MNESLLKGGLKTQKGGRDADRIQLSGGFPQVEEGGCSTEAVSQVPSHTGMKSYENKKKSIWFDGFLMTCYLWKIHLVFI